MSDIQVPFVELTRDMKVAHDEYNKIRYLAKTVGYYPEVVEYVRNLKALLRMYGYKYDVRYEGNKVYVVIGSEEVEV